MKIHIIWDWDGTLADTIDTLNSAYSYALKKTNITNKTFSLHDIHKISGDLQNKDIGAYVFGDKKEEACKHLYEYISQNHLKDLKLIPNADKVLEHCKKNKITSYLLSNKTNKKIVSEGREAYLIKEVKTLGVKKYFTNIIGSGELEEDKPSLLSCKAIFGDIKNFPTFKNNEKVFVVGDGKADIQVAENLKKAGLNSTSILYDPKNSYNGNLSPDHKIKNLLSIVELIDKTKTKES